MIEIQRKARENAQEVKDFLRTLDSWGDDMKREEVDAELQRLLDKKEEEKAEADALREAEYDLELERSVEEYFKAHPERVAEIPTFEHDVWVKNKPENKQSCIVAQLNDKQDGSSPTKTGDSPTIKIESRQEVESVMVGVPGLAKTASRFVDDWRQLKSKTEKAHYLKQYTAKDFGIFKDALDYNLLIEILNVVGSEFTAKSWDVTDAMEGLINVKRFSTILMFFTEEDKKLFQKLVEGIQKVDVKDRCSKLC